MVESLVPDGKWTLLGNVNMKAKYWGRSVEIDPNGQFIIDFPRCLYIF